MTNIKDRILNRTSFLYNEPLNLLFEEFKDYSRYFAILNAIAEGASTFSEISTRSRIPQNKLSKYLMTLERVGITRKIIPITERKSKRVIYRIADNFYRFWFRYLYPNKSFLELGETGYVMEEIKKTFNAFVGLAFEGIAAEFLRMFNNYRVGKWWYKDTEIDLVGLREGEVAFFEVKWRDMSYGDAINVLRRLEEKAEAVKLKGKRRYGLIARKIEGKDKLEGDYHVYDLSDLSEKIRDFTTKCFI